MALLYSSILLAVHLWKYPGGYPVLNRATEIYRTDSVSGSKMIYPVQ